MRRANRWYMEAKRTLEAAPSLEVSNMGNGGVKGKQKGLVTTRRSSGIQKRSYAMARSRRGRRRQAWVNDLYDMLVGEFRQAQRA